MQKQCLSQIQRPDEWEQLDLTVDSGSCVAVMPRGLCTGIGIMQSFPWQHRVGYEVANGDASPNLEERQCKVMIVGSVVLKRVTFQVSDAHKLMFSITACAYAF